VLYDVIPGTCITNMKKTGDHKALILLKSYSSIGLIRNIKLCVNNVCEENIEMFLELFFLFHLMCTKGNCFHLQKKIKLSNQEKVVDNVMCKP